VPSWRLLPRESDIPRCSFSRVARAHRRLAVTLAARPLRARQRPDRDACFRAHCGCDLAAIRGARDSTSTNKSHFARDPRPGPMTVALRLGRGRREAVARRSVLLRSAIDGLAIVGQEHDRRAPGCCSPRSVAVVCRCLNRHLVASASSARSTPSTTVPPVIRVMYPQRRACGHVSISIWSMSSATRIGLGRDRPPGPRGRTRRRVGKTSPAKCRWSLQ
jgi:hypothetical protein